jgi:hypothetical protein
MPPNIRSALASLLLALAFTTQAQAQNLRLLPDSYTQSIQLKWVQDGRVVNLEIDTPKGDFVIVEFELLAHYRRCNTLLSNVGIDDTECPKSPERHLLKMEGQPGTNFVAHLEIRSKEELVKLEIASARSRPLTKFERLKAIIR